MKPQAAAEESAQSPNCKRAKRRQRRTSDNPVSQIPWQEVRNPYPPIEVLNEEQLQRIHQSSLDVLSELGLRILDGRARDYLRKAGAEVDDETEIVKFDPEMVMEMVAHAPAEVTLHARNDARNIVLGGNNIVYSSTMCPPFANDLDRGRRSGTFEEMCDFVRVVQSLNIIHQAGGGGFEALDLAPETRHLDVTYAHILLTDKTWKAWSNGITRCNDAIDMACITMGISRDELAEKPMLTAPINTNSPLQIDIPMAEGIIEMAKVKQPLVIAPFTMAGAMSPATEAGAMVVQNTEALAGIVLAQSVQKDAPVVYGSFTTNVDMQSGSPAFGTPVFAKATWASGQLARFYGVPFRSSCNTSANSVDAQAAYESQLCLWAAVTAHANIIFSAAGWLESGLSGSFEKLIVDAEMLQLLAESLQPMDVSDDAIGLDAIREVGHGGHFFGAKHTLSRYKNAFYKELLSDRNNFETWTEKGRQDATQRANTIWKKLLADYQQPYLDPAIDEELKAFVARRKKEIVSGTHNI